MRPSAAAAAVVLALLVPSSASAAGYSSPGGELELRMAGGQVELVRDGAVVATAAPGADWTIEGPPDIDDTLTVRNPDGGILPADVDFDGGAGGFDTLNVRGGRSDEASATPDGPDAGRLVHRRGADILAVDYAGLEPITDTVPEATFTIDYGPANHAITIDNGSMPADGVLRVDTPDTEEINFSNKTSVTINGNGGTDTVTITNTEAATGLTGAMAVNTGPESGEFISVDSANYTGADLLLTTTGPITDLNGTATNVTGDALAADAGSGIALDTAVGRLEAGTDTGSILLGNTGDLIVGGLSGTLHGLRIGGDTAGGTGSVSLDVGGSLTLDDATGPEAVRSGFDGGAVALQASGMFTTTAGQDAARAPAGSAGVTAGDFAIAAGSELAAASVVALANSGDIVLGGTGSGAALSDAELDQVAAPTLDVIGANVRVTGGVSIDPARVPSMELGTSGVVEQTAGAISAKTLRVLADSTVALGAAQNDVDEISGVGTSFDYRDADDLAIVGTGVRSTTGALELQAHGFAGPGALTAQQITLSDGSATGRTWTIDAGSVSDGRAAIPYSDANALAVNGGGGADRFNVKASPNTAIAIDGGAPAAAPGDVLTYDPEGRGVSGDLTPPSGQIESPGVQPVTFANVEAGPFDLDEDGVADSSDNCPAVANPDQEDRDGDGIGRECDPVDLAPGVCANPFGGTPGPDSLEGTAMGDFIEGAGGNDTIRGRGGADCLDGEAGADDVLGGGASDRLRGGTGRDRLVGGGGGDRILRGEAGADALSGGGGADRLAGGKGGDRLTGGGKADFLSGGVGNDRLIGGGGRDRLFGRAGNDRIVATGGKLDTIACGSGVDRVVADPRDRVRGCERVRLPS